MSSDSLQRYNEADGTVSCHDIRVLFIMHSIRSYRVISSVCCRHHTGKAYVRKYIAIKLPKHAATRWLRILTYVTFSAD